MGQFFKLPVFLKLTNTDPFAAWFVVTGDATPGGIRVVRSVLGSVACEVRSRRAYTFESLNSGLESNKEEEKTRESNVVKAMACFRRCQSVGGGVMAPRTDRTTRIPPGVASPVSTNHAAKGSAFCHLRNTGNLKNWPAPDPGVRLDCLICAISGLDCLICAISGLDCLICALTVLYVPYPGVEGGEGDGLLPAVPERREHEPRARPEHRVDLPPPTTMFTSSDSRKPDTSS